uniref:Uncharacterized protein n=1 Tax=Mycena chlorophos TaxID=658473 RepID=A0ABQ0M7A8_MYCCL|nr:predicted protein [Mycena chlorophos]
MTDVLQVSQTAGDELFQQVEKWLATERGAPDEIRLLAFTDKHCLCFCSPPLHELFSGLYPYDGPGRLADEMHAYFHAAFKDVVVRGEPNDDWDQMLAYKRAAVYERFPALL